MTRDRGRSAERPHEMTVRGWRDILLRVKDEMAADNTSLIAAGLALYALLAAFPATAAALSIYGWFASPALISEQFQNLRGVLPPDATEILRQSVQNIASRDDETLGVGGLIAFFVALWSARKGMVALINAINIAYDESDRRSWLRELCLSLAFALGSVFAFVSVLLLGVAAPVAIESVTDSQSIQVALGVIRWIALWAVSVLGLAVVYRFAPHREPAKWRWVTWGSVVAASLWLMGSIAFTLYVQNFGKYGETYGALGGVVVLLLWFYMTGYIVIIGAELNAELEHQTARDTTTGARRPLGQRGAYVADTLGERP